LLLPMGFGARGEESEFSRAKNRRIPPSG